MHPSSQPIWTPEARARYGIRGMEDFSPEELTVLHAKLAGWIRQRGPRPVRTRHRALFVMKRRPAAPA